ncbi:MAG TPA: ATP-binding protein [Candidatus Krumholzibacteria bacterium]|nr:ATP-binding protein [Candidatus Krumholzibacteria bacterium]HPD72399.1 ATP-binding protein [Candidatus Krumholzibacteria bacterium]HRY40669.1 ATP-binding protein [Candidatus Krumholzibacteria bacterium]
MIRFGRTYGLVALMVLVVTLMHYNTAIHIHAAHGIYRRLYYFPIIVAAFRGGRRAGWWTAVAVCLLYIPHAFGLIGFDPAPALEKVLEMVLYLAVGLVTGLLEDRGRRVRDRLRHALAERERLERELVRRERLAAVGQLSAGLAHEIRNPLASIKGATEILGDLNGLDQGRSRMLAILREETTRLNEVLTQFLDFARPAESGRTRFDLGGELARLAELLAHRSDAPRVRVDVPAAPVECEADRAQVRQLLLNLGLNAAQAAGPAPAGEVALGLRRDGLRLVVSVTDNGPGFSPEALRNLGTPFFTTRSGGTGLGLATSLRFARDHGGDLAVDEEYTGGARVTVWLPAAQGGA